MSSSVISPVGSGHANEVVLKRLGATAVCASRLERLVAEIAHDLKVDESGAIAQLRNGDFTMPPWTSTRAADVTAWAAGAARLLSVRSSVFAASGGARFTGTRGDTIATESTDGSIFPADEEYLDRLVTRLERHIAVGLELRAGLDYHDEQGRSWPLVTIYRRSLQDPASERQLRLPADWERWLSA